MLDDAMGLTASISRGFGIIVPTLQMTVSFLRPTPMERVLARGEALRVGSSTAQMQATLRRADGTILAHGTASAAVRTFPKSR
jgi:acyl-coenzyme A thioesterase PaaI-like protein